MEEDFFQALADNRIDEIPKDLRCQCGTKKGRPIFNVVRLFEDPNDTIWTAMNARYTSAYTILRDGLAVSNAKELSHTQRTSLKGNTDF